MAKSEAFSFRSRGRTEGMHIKLQTPRIKSRDATHWIAAFRIAVPVHLPTEEAF